MSDDIVKEANEKIAALLKEAETKLREATDIADEVGIMISWDGPAYGMGGWYHPTGWNDSGCEWESSDAGEWKASSYSC